MRLLITGVAGFIGSHVTESLLADGHEVVGVDNFDPFYDRALKEANLRACADHQSFLMVEEDIRNAEAMVALTERNGPFDVILHLAARAGVRPSIADPIGYTAVNVLGTTNLLQAATQCRPLPRFIFASSSSVYGNNEKVPFSETDPVERPISPYAATKRAGELICHSFHHLYGLPVYCLRFFTVYGPRQRPDLAINKFVRQVLAGHPIQMFGDGSTARDYTYISDIVFGVRRAIDRCQGYEILNLGSRNPITLKEMIEVVGKACGRKPVIEAKPMQPGDVNRTFADVTKAHHLLGYKPSMPFQEGVLRFVEWYRSTMAGAAIRSDA